MIGISGWTARTLATICRVGSRLNSAHVVVGEGAGPGIEQLQHLGAGLDLLDQVLAGGLDQQRDQRREILLPAIHPALGFGKVPARPAFDHVGRHRPRRAGKPDQRRLRRQVRPEARRPSHRPGPDADGTCRAQAAPGPCRPSAPPAPARALPRSRPSGPGHPPPPGCRRTGSPHRSRSAGSAAASPRSPAPGCSKGPGTSPPPPGSRDIPADSARPGA